jgi:hypothetical protein
MSTTRESIYVDPDDVPYARLVRSYGITEMKLIHVDLAGGIFTMISKWDAGTQLPRHLHTGSVFAQTFSGAWRYLEYDWVARPGAYVYEPPGTEHTLYAEEATVAMFIAQGSFIWYDDDGRMAKHQDATSTLADVQAALAADGLHLPPGVVR